MQPEGWTFPQLTVEEQMFPVGLLLDRSHSPGSLRQQVSCCVATCPQIFMVLMTTNGVGERRGSFREGERLGF